MAKGVFCHPSSIACPLKGGCASESDRRELHHLELDVFAGGLLRSLLFCELFGQGQVRSGPCGQEFHCGVW